MATDREILTGVKCVHSVIPVEGRMKQIEHFVGTPHPIVETVDQRVVITEDHYRELFEKMIRLTVNDGDASPRTVAAYREGLAVFFGWCEAKKLDPKVVTCEQVQEYRRWLAERYKPATSRLRLRSVRVLYAAMQRWGVRQDNPAEGIRAAKSRTSAEDMVLQKALAPHEARAYWAQVWPVTELHKVQEAAVIGLLMWAALRADEVRNLKVLSIDPSLVYLDLEGKGKKRRRIYLPAPVRESLGAWLQARGWATGPEMAFYTLISGVTRPVSVRWVERLADRHLKAAGLKSNGRSAHALRHTALMLAVLGGASREAIGDMAGHGQLSTTDVYIRAAARYQSNPADAAYKAAQEAK